MKKRKPGANSDRERATKDRSVIRSLEARIKELEQECDGYRKALLKTLPPSKTRLTKKQAEELIKNSVPFERVIEEVERELGLNR